MSTEEEVDDDCVDCAADRELQACLDLDRPRSFFLYAGAGSGKTRSLVKALGSLTEDQLVRMRLMLRGQRIGVITFTNAACDEINRRVKFDPLIQVQTIHAFAWLLIQGHHHDIREWLRDRLKQDIAEETDKQAKGRAGTKAAGDRVRKIAHMKRRLAELDSIGAFVYSPSGDNSGRDSLNHSEVIAIASDLLKNRPTLAEILVTGFPILFIDESQDTQRELLEALLAVQEASRERFCLGLVGDTMQRIYGHGKEGIEAALGDDWARPAKRMNHRSAERIVRLINGVRLDADGRQQQARRDAPRGTVRLFVARHDAADKVAVEAEVARQMADLTGDLRWGGTAGNYWRLVLEHRMAAKRMGFDEFFAPLYRVDSFKTGLTDPENLSAPVRLFACDVWPLVEAMRRGDQFSVAAIVRHRSPLLAPDRLKGAHDQRAVLATAREATEALAGLWKGGHEPTFMEVLKCVHAHDLFVVPEALRPIVARPADGSSSTDEGDEGDEGDEEIRALDEMLGTPFRQIEPYTRYIGDEDGDASFRTHQGVKGLEHPRVMVVIDDHDAGGFLFSYEKLFGVKDASDTDRKNESAGRETTFDRTRRLFYVTCSRARESLVVVVYTESPGRAKNHAVTSGWFDENEVVLLS